MTTEGQVFFTIGGLGLGIKFEWLLVLFHMNNVMIICVSIGLIQLISFL